MSPSLDRMPVVGPALRMQRRYGEVHGGVLASNLTYYGFLSLFPLLLLALSAVGFLVSGDPATSDRWIASLADAVPGLGPLIGENLEAVAAGRAGLGILGLLGLLWTGTQLTQAGGYTMSRVLDAPVRRGFVRTKTWALWVTVALGVLMLTGLGVSGLIGGADIGLLRIVAFPAAVVFDGVVFLVAYRLLTQRPGPPLALLWPGALAAAVGWAALKVAGTWYASRSVAGATAVYGAFGSVVGMLAVLHLGSRVFVYGAVINALKLEQPGGDSMESRTTDRDGHGDGGPTAEAGRPPTSELVTSIATDLGTLVRKEIELAKHEVTEAVVARVMGAAAFAVAGLVGLFALGFAGLAVAAALDTVMAPWASRLIVAAAFLAIVGGAAAFGLMRKRRPPIMPEETMRTVKEDVEWARTQLRR